MRTLISRTVELLRAEGYVAESVEQFNYYSKRSKDLFGFIDVIAVHPAKSGALGVQVTNSANAANRLKKALANPNLETWLQAGNRFEIHAWRKSPEKRGSKRLTWKVTRKEVTLYDLSVLGAKPATS